MRMRPRLLWRIAPLCYNLASKGMWYLCEGSSIKTNSRHIKWRQSPFVDTKVKATESNTKSKKKKKSNAFKSGFLLNQKQKSAKRNKNRSRKVTKLQSNQKENPLVIPEAQEKLNGTQGKRRYILGICAYILFFFTEAKLGKMAQELHKDKDLWNAMLSPSFGTAMNEFSTNPQEALIKYQNDPNVLPMLSKMVKTMYGKSLPSISKDIHAQIQKQKEANGDNQDFLDSLKIFKS